MHHAASYMHMTIQKHRPFDSPLTSCAPLDSLKPETGASFSGAVAASTSFAASFSGAVGASIPVKCVRTTNEKFENESVKLCKRKKMIQMEKMVPMRRSNRFYQSKTKRNGRWTSSVTNNVFEKFSGPQNIVFKLGSRDLCCFLLRVGLFYYRHFI